ISSLFRDPMEHLYDAPDRVAFLEGIGQRIAVNDRPRRRGVVRDQDGEFSPFSSPSCSKFCNIPRVAAVIRAKSGMAILRNASIGMLHIAASMPAIIALSLSPALSASIMQ